MTFTRQPLPLFDAPAPIPLMETAFDRFHRENPRVYELFCEYTQLVINAGRKRFSAYAVFNRLRWHYAFESTDMTFKLNNNLQPHYARLWLKDHTEHAGLFSLRTMKGEAQ